jgi:hypothetical protein
MAELNTVFGAASEEMYKAAQDKAQANGGAQGQQPTLPPPKPRSPMSTSRRGSEGPAKNRLACRMDPAIHILLFAHQPA